MINWHFTSSTVWNIVILGLAIILCSCSKDKKEEAPVELRHVILLSIDQLSSKDLIQYELSNIELLYRSGSYSFNVTGNTNYAADICSLVNMHVQVKSDSSLNLIEELDAHIFRLNKSVLTNDSGSILIDNFDLILEPEFQVFVDSARTVLANNKPNFFLIELTNRNNINIEDYLVAADSLVGIIMEEVGYSSMYGKTIITVAGLNALRTNELKPVFIANGTGLRSGFEIAAEISLDDIPATILKFFELDLPKTWEGKPITEMLKSTE